MVISSATTQVVTRSQFQNNGGVAGSGAATGQIGIDLLSVTDNASTGTAPFVTRNDIGDTDTGGNGLLNFPVLESAAVVSGSLTVTGWARPGSTIELFISDGDPSGFGEGVTYAATLVEGSASDLDASTSSYSGTINGLNQGADNTNRFRFTLAAPSGVGSGARLTATATLVASGTSEFSGVVVVGGGVSVRGYAYADANHNLAREAGEAGTGATLYAKLVPTGGSSTKRSANEKANMAQGRQRRIVWVQDGLLLRAVPITLGLIENQFAEVIAGDLHDGQAIVTGVEGALLPR